MVNRIQTVYPCWDWTCNLRSWLIEFKQSTPVVQINSSVQDSVWTSEFDMKHMKKAKGHIARNVVIITIKMGVNSLNILSNNNYQASSQKFRQIISMFLAWHIFNFYKYHMRCPWCNGYRRRNWTWRHEFKSWTDCISHSTNTLGKGMNPMILPPAMGK